MDLSAIIFYIISAFTLVAAILAVTTRKIFRSAIWLLFSLMGVAALYFWMQVNFIAAVQIIVYVGGIVVLIIFSIFLTQRSGLEMLPPRHNRMLFSLMAALFGFGFTYNLINHNAFPQKPGIPFTADVTEIGTQLLSTSDYGFILPFEVVSILLLAAMIGCIVIAMKPQKEIEDNDENGNGEQIVQPAGAQYSKLKTDLINEKMEDMKG